MEQEGKKVEEEEEEEEEEEKEEEEVVVVWYLTQLACAVVHERGHACRASALQL